MVCFLCFKGAETKKLLEGHQDCELVTTRTDFTFITLMEHIKQKPIKIVDLVCSCSLFFVVLTVLN